MKKHHSLLFSFLFHPRNNMFPGPQLLRDPLEAQSSTTLLSSTYNPLKIQAAFNPFNCECRRSDVPCPNMTLLVQTKPMIIDPPRLRVFRVLHNMPLHILCLSPHLDQIFEI